MSLEPPHGGPTAAHPAPCRSPPYVGGAHDDGTRPATTLKRGGTHRPTPMQSPAGSRDLYPHREVGIVLLILAVLLFIFAALLGGVCAGGAGTPGGPSPMPAACFYPYSGAAVILGLLGLLFIILGIVLVVVRAASPYPVAAYPAPGWPAPTAPMVHTLISCRSCGRVYSTGIYAFCPACGNKLGP